MNEGISTLKDQFRTGEGDNKASVEPLWSLKKLSLSENGLNDMCQDSLSEMVRFLPRLETLDLSHNFFTT